MSETHNISRRSFLHTTAVASATVAAWGVPAVNVLGANDTLHVGCIGTGGRCRALLKALVKIPKVRVTALCDVWDVSLTETKKITGDDVFTTKDSAELLARKDVDAVLIASPDHWHVPMTIEACAAGKDVYVEKPLTHDLSEGKAVVEAVRKHERIVQVGTQQRSMPHIQKAYELLKSGRIGKVHKIHLTWNRNSDRVRRNPLGVDPKSVDWKRFVGNAKAQDFDEYRFRNWRWFWDFGGGIFTDLMVHWIDVAHWFLDLDHPLKATSIGEHIASKDVWETPDTVQTLLVYKDGLQAYFEGTFVNARNGAMIEFMGSEGTLYIDRGRYEVHPDTRKGVVLGEYEEMVLGSGKRGLDFYDKPDGEMVHLANWVDCVRSRKTPTAPVEGGVGSASAAHLANEALRTGQVAVWKG